ncbi:MAG: class I SAM-dependent methyltransferase [Bryobacteraceae bacterium]
MKKRDWNSLAKKFETHVCDLTAKDVSRTVPTLVEAARIPKSKAVLVDLGCGIGTFIRRFGGQFETIYGVDFADRILERAKKRQPSAIRLKVTWIAEDLPTAAKAIGQQAHLTVCLNVITSSDAAVRRKLWKSVAAVTKTRGYALVGIPAFESAQMVYQFERKPGSKQPAKLTKTLLNRAGATQKHFSEDELEKTFATYGFKLRAAVPAYVPWSEEGLKKPKGVTTEKPFDWLCLAQRI